MIFASEINGNGGKGGEITVILKGVMTHFASAESGPAYTHFQFDNFLSFLGRLPENNPSGRGTVVIAPPFLLFRKCILIYPGWGLPSGVFLPGEEKPHCHWI